MRVMVVEESLVAGGHSGGLDRIQSFPAVGVATAPGRRRGRRGRGGARCGRLRGAGAGPPARGRSRGRGAAGPAETMEREVVRLPDAARAAAWVVGVAMAEADEGSPPLRALQALAGAADRLGARSDQDGEPRMPAIRPAVLLRWARSGWRPCDRCAGGGLPGPAAAGAARSMAGRAT